MSADTLQQATRIYTRLAEPTKSVEYKLVITTIRLAVWLSGNAFASINVVALRQTRLAPGWG